MVKIIYYCHGACNIFVGDISMKRFVGMIVTVAISFQGIAQEVERIAVIGQSPIGQHNNQSYLLGTVQTIDANTIERSNVKTLSQQLALSLASVRINDVQNNPFQPDVQYRGFTASPLLGLPQGISVYLDGSRFNEPFGDTVNWDLIPLSSIDNIALFSGSNPIFGQNTLGGALALTTKDGFSYQQHDVTLGLGSFGQRQFNIQSGDHNERWGYYLNFNRYQEGGWRDASPSDVRQLLVNAKYRGDHTNLKLLYVTNDNQLIGNGAVPIELLTAQSATAIYTQPDQTATNLSLWSLASNTTINNYSSFDSNIYYRRNTIASINGDDSDFDPCMVKQKKVLCDDDEELLLSQPISVDLEEVDGSYNTSRVKNDSYGITLQYNYQFQLANTEQSLMIGAGLESANIDFVSDSQLAILHNDSAADDRSVTPISSFILDSMVKLDASNKHHFSYFSHTIEWPNQLTVNLAGRYNYSKVVLNDLIDSGEGSLDGDHEFRRFNPAIGVSYPVTENFHLKWSYSESSRTPSPAELSCADEDDPCKLPNGFVSDPPLEQVVVKTHEVSGSFGTEHQKYTVTAYRSESHDDIIFQQAGSKSSEGFFVNVDKTQRQGFEFAGAFEFEDSQFNVSYNYLDATFQSPFVSFSPVNPQGENRQVMPGDTIPGQPKHQLKLMFNHQINDSNETGAEFTASSSQYYRGDEANENDKIAGHGVINWFYNYQITAELSLSLRVDNVLDKQYFTFGGYGEADEVLGDIYPTISSELFVGPAAPRSYSVNLSYQF